jgi:hypothetical protein
VSTPVFTQWPLVPRVALWLLVVVVVGCGEPVVGKLELLQPGRRVAALPLLLQRVAEIIESLTTAFRQHRHHQIHTRDVKQEPESRHRQAYFKS